MMSLEQTLPRLKETQAEKESGSSSRERKGREHVESTNVTVTEGGVNGNSKHNSAC